MDDNIEIYARLALAFGIGLMVGVERGWRARERPAGSRAAGIRTFTLIGLLGGLAALLEGDGALLAGFLGVLVLMAAAYVTGLAANPDRSITGEVAALATYALGALAVRGDMVVAAAGAAALVAVLGSREAIHSWVRQIERVQLKAAIQLMVISMVILPVLPDKGFGPGDVLNPFELWWMVVVIVGISFLAMALVNRLGPHAGLLSMGLLGGMASSTAVAIGGARLAADTPVLSPLLAASVGAATMVKFLRSLLVAAIIYPTGALVLAPGLVLAAVSAGVATLFIARAADRAEPDRHEIDFGKSGDLTTAMSFAAFLGLVTLASYYADVWFGGLGVLAVSAVSGLVDVDAVTVSTARQAAASGDAALMALAVTAALTVNTLSKAAYIAVIAGRAMSLRYAVIAAASIAGLGLGVLIG